MKLSLVCPTFNGLSLLEKNLSLWLRTLGLENIDFEIVIVDNGSLDGTGEWLSQFDNVVCLTLDKNHGFAHACNRGSLEAKGEYLFFINNDISWDDETPFFSHLINIYESEGNNIFALTPMLVRENDKSVLDDGLRIPVFKEGLLDVPLSMDISDKENKKGIFFCAAAFLVTKEKFLRLNGFDEMYSPFAWEDLDLGMRVVKAGFYNMCAPRYKLLHQRETTSKKIFSENEFKTHVWRNKFIFMWRHFDGVYLWLHIVWLPVKLVKFLFNGRISYVIGFLKALKTIPKILKKRRLEKIRLKKTFTNILRAIE